MFSIAETEAQREGSSHLSSSGDIAVSQAAARGPRPEEVDPGGRTVQRSLLQRRDRSVSAPSGPPASRPTWLPGN